MKVPEGISPPYMNNSFGCISMSGYPNISNVPIGVVQNDIGRNALITCVNIITSCVSDTPTTPPMLCCNVPVRDSANCAI